MYGRHSAFINSLGEILSFKELYLQYREPETVKAFGIRSNEMIGATEVEVIESQEDLDTFLRFE